VKITHSGTGISGDKIACFNPKVPHWVSIYAECRPYTGVAPYDVPGIVRVYLDGKQVLEYSGQTAYYIYFLYGWNKVGWTSAYNGVYVDDLIVHDDTFVGPCDERFIAPIVPNGDNAIELTRSTGTTNYSCVDEIPPSTTDYCSTTVTNKADHYNMTTIGWTPDTIDCVGVWTYAMQNGTITQLQHGLYDPGTTTEYTQTKTLTTSGTYYTDCKIFETEPISSTAWDKAEVDAAVSTARLV
jgi:hypothetical protein